MEINRSGQGIFEAIPFKTLVTAFILLGIYSFSIFPICNYHSKLVFVSLLLFYLTGTLFILYSYIKPCAILRNIGILTMALLTITLLFIIFPSLLARLRGAIVIPLGTATVAASKFEQFERFGPIIGLILPTISTIYFIIDRRKVVEVNIK